MRILNVFGFFVILCINSNQFTFARIVIPDDLDIVTQNCNNLEESSALLRLKRHLYCDYDRVVYPNFPGTTNVSLSIMPKLINFEADNVKLSLHSWMILSWTDPRLTWTPSDYDEITFIHIQSWQIWLPDLCINNSADIASEQYETIPLMTECLLFSSGSINCVPAVKFISKCTPDYTYWPYDKHQCPVTFISWTHKGEEVNLLMDGNGVCALIENHLIL